MHRRLLVALALAALIGGCRKSIDARVTDEIARLDAALTKISSGALPEELEPLAKQHRSALEHARAATSPDLRLYRLRDAFVGIELLSVVAEQKTATGSYDALQRLWTAQRARFETPMPAAGGPLLHRALIENAHNRAQKLYRASLPYAKASAPLSGLFYFAEAEGNLRFRDFVVSLGDGAGAAHAAAATVRSELEMLERESLKKFEADPSGRTTIRASAHLKEARELYEQRLLDGAALALVESRAALDAAAEEAIPTALADLASRRLPESRRAAKPAGVTVTLVRWPYT